LSFKNNIYIISSYIIFIEPRKKKSGLTVLKNLLPSSFNFFFIYDKGAAAGRCERMHRAVHEDPVGLGPRKAAAECQPVLRAARQIPHAVRVDRHQHNEPAQ